MNTTGQSPVSRVRDAIGALSNVVKDFHASECVSLVDDAELIGLLTAAGEALRSAESLVVVGGCEVQQRSATADVAERLSTRLGCASASEVVQQTTRVSSAASRSMLRVAEATKRSRSITTGELLEAPLPALRQTILDGEIGAGAAASIVGAIRPPGRSFDAELVAVADTALAAAARGYEFDPEAGETSTEATMPATADTLRMHANVWANVIDADGAEPVEHAALRKRGVTLGAVKDGLVELRGHLLPEGAEQIQRFFDAMGTPRDTKASRVSFRPSDELTRDERAGDELTRDERAGMCGSAGADGSVNGADRLGAAGGPGGSDAPGGPGDAAAAAEQRARDAYCGCEDPSRCSCAPLEVADSRTAAQKRHDAFITAFMVAAASEDAPTIGGAAPTLVVMVDDESLASGTGTAFLPSTAASVPLEAAHHAGCAGTTQRVSITGDGRITHISTENRVFNAHQRRAIALRDGGCVIPGCTTPAAWCEINHVNEHANGGATHTDNGVMLCWFHHRYLAISGWTIRMTSGIPEVRAPNWIDPTGRWRRSTSSSLRLTRRAKRRGSPPPGVKPLPGVKPPPPISP